MNLKKWFIGMSINKQLYFGICGISFLFGVLCLLLIILASAKLFFLYNLQIKTLFNELDTNIISLNGENADLFGQLVYNQGKFESFLIRSYYNILLHDFGKELVENIIIENTEINNHFKLHTDTSNLCEEENSKCYFVFKMNKEISDSTKKILYFLIPILEISLDIRAYNKDNFLIFNNFIFYENQNYILYKYNKTDMDINFNEKIPPISLINNILTLFSNQINVIEELNTIKVNEKTNYQLFKENTYIVSPSYKLRLFIDPLNKKLEHFFHFSSFLFDENILKDNENVNISKLIPNYLKNYLSFTMKINYLVFFILNFIQRNEGIFIVVGGDDLTYIVGKSICNVLNYTKFSYSDYSINNNFNFTVEYLAVDKSQITSIINCFENDNIIDIISSDNNYNYKLKVLSNLYYYNYDKDINNYIVAKIIRQLSPNKYIKSFMNLKFFSSTFVYLVVIKIYNNIMIINNLIDRISHRGICYITLMTFILWLIIYLFILIKLYLVTDRISSPIRKLIKNLSLSQGDFNNERTNIEKIYYKEDKDINDLFQLCQKLIIGGFKKKINIKKQNKLNVYNNISKVKTNNMIINENDIIVQRNQKYNEIFEKEKKIKKKKDKFKDDLYHHYKNNDLESKVQNYENLKIKYIPPENKQEIENNNTQDNEYKMFYYIHKEIEGYLPYNNLYKCYYDEFFKNDNKKKKK